MDKRFNITIHTRITKSINNEPANREVEDTLVLHNVDETVRNFIASSCKATLMRLIKFPENTTGDIYVVQYRTLVQDENYKTVSDTGFITFPAMDHDHIVQFQLWAANELLETIKVKSQTYEDMKSPSIYKKPNPIKTFFSVMYQLVQNKLASYYDRK